MQMARLTSSHQIAVAKPDRAEPEGAPRQAALRLPVPVPLLMQLLRPLNTMEDVQALAAQLASARARGCF